MRRIAVFVDGSNFFYLQRDFLGWWIDPGKLLSWLGKRGTVVDATYYVSVDQANEGQRNYLKALTHMGFRVETKNIKLYKQDDGSQRHKANMDIEIVVDMFNQIESYDEVVLISGDSDFARALQMLRARGKQFLVMSTNGLVASEMRAVAGMHYQDIGELKEFIEKD